MRYWLGEYADQEQRKAEIGMAGLPLAWEGIELDDLDVLQQINQSSFERMNQIGSLRNKASCSTGSRSATVVMPTLFIRASTEA